MEKTKITVFFMTFNQRLCKINKQICTIIKMWQKKSYKKLYLYFFRKKEKSLITISFFKTVAIKFLKCWLYVSLLFLIFKIDTS